MFTLLGEVSSFNEISGSGAHTFFQLPLVHGTVHARRDETRIVWRPVDRAHLAIVPAAIANVLARVCGKNLGERTMGGRIEKIGREYTKN